MRDFLSSDTGSTFTLSKLEISRAKSLKSMVTPLRYNYHLKDKNQTITNRKYIPINSKIIPIITILQYYLSKCKKIWNIYTIICR